MSDFARILAPYRAINTFQAIVPLTAHEKGVNIMGEHISLKN
jgi:hypothetical protein